MTFKVPTDEAKRWQELASKAHTTLTAWVRGKCNGEVSSLTAAAERRGMDAAWLAERIEDIIEDPEAFPRDKLAAVKTLVAARGEQTEGSSTRNITNINTPKALVIVGDMPTVGKMLKP